MAAVCKAALGRVGLVAGRAACLSGAKLARPPVDHLGKHTSVSYNRICTLAAKLLLCQ